jgi:hypothetical protein
VPRSIVARRRVQARTLTTSGRELVEYLVWTGGPVSEAHRAIGISPSWTRTLLGSTPVINHLKAEMEIRRNGERPRNLQRLAEIRDQDENRTAAVTAIRTLELISDTERRSPISLTITPGYVIRVREAAAPVTIEGVSQSMDANPLISHGDRVNGALNRPVMPAADDPDVLWLDGRGEDDEATP